MENIFEKISLCCEELKLNFESKEVATWANTNGIGDTDLSTVLSFISTVEKKISEDSVSFLMRLSRLPKDCGTIESFKTNRFDAKAEADEVVKTLKTLAFVETGMNLIFTGNTGTGKTHLAQALALECCRHKIKTYYLTFRELDEMFTKARALGRTRAVISSLCKYTCLVIDKVSDLKMDEENTCLFAGLVDKRNQKNHGSMILTSGSTPSYWTEYFTGTKVLETTIDRLMDKAICIAFSGESYRGTQRKVFQFKTMAEMALVPINK